MSTAPRLVYHDKYLFDWRELCWKCLTPDQSLTPVIDIVNHYRTNEKNDITFEPETPSTLKVAFSIARNRLNGFRDYVLVLIVNELSKTCSWHWIDLSSNFTKAFVKKLSSSRDSKPATRTSLPSGNHNETQTVPLCDSVLVEGTTFEVFMEPLICSVGKKAGTHDLIHNRIHAFFNISIGAQLYVCNAKRKFESYAIHMPTAQLPESHIANQSGELTKRMKHQVTSATGGDRVKVVASRAFGKSIDHRSFVNIDGLPKDLKENWKETMKTLSIQRLCDAINEVEARCKLANYSEDQCDTILGELSSRLYESWGWRANEMIDIPRRRWSVNRASLDLDQVMILIVFTSSRFI